MSHERRIHERQYIGSSNTRDLLILLTVIVIVVALFVVVVVAVLHRPFVLAVQVVAVLHSLLLYQCISIGQHGIDDDLAMVLWKI